MKTSMALSFLDLRRYRWLPYLLIAMTLFAVLAGIILIRFVEYRLVEATGGELTLAAAEVAEKLDRMYVRTPRRRPHDGTSLFVASLRSELSLRVSAVDEKGVFPCLSVVSGLG